MKEHPLPHTPVTLREILPHADTTGILDIDSYAECMSGRSHWRERLLLSQRTNVGFAAPGGDFTRAVLEHFRVQKEESVVARIPGTTVVELGAGMSACGYELAVLLGASAYIAIEAFYADCVTLSIIQQSLHYAPRHRIPYCVLAEDILSSLLRIPDHSVSLFAFGIESCILGGDQYKKQIQGELTRVLNSEGGFLSLRSDIFPVADRIHRFNVNRKGFVEEATLAVVSKQ